MPETWISGRAFSPRLYGPEHLVPVRGISGTEFNGTDANLTQGRWFSLRGERVIAFLADIPVTGTQHLTQLRFELVYGSSYDQFRNARAWPELTRVTAQAAGPSPWIEIVSDSPTVTAGGPTPGDPKVVTLSGINRDVQRYISVSLTFSTLSDVFFVGAGDVIIVAASAAFA